ncbi:PREDICTED: natural killer cells antigen CD94-like [Propithecus coquereli]|uniref:natural killer cells antigen CD94-like n=1 Tax=Propithecus coquereli TaxID=379532 RepID=UPI00063FB1B2|nr:PREDICTED: natural killer cells antigen CD94-like [Propithecus coquereli]
MAVSQTTRWRLICGTLGVICLLLMATLGFLLKFYSEPTSSPGLDIELQEAFVIFLGYNMKPAFMHSSQHFYWIGLSYNEESGDWRWENGSAVSWDLFSSFETLDKKNCIAYKPMNGAMDEPCERENHYICKQQLI